MCDLCPVENRGRAAWRFTTNVCARLSHGAPSQAQAKKAQAVVPTAFALVLALVLLILVYLLNSP